MGRRANPVVGPDTDVRLRVVLAAFVYYPAYRGNVSYSERGLQSRDLIRVAPITFSHIWTGRERRGTNVSLCVRMAAHRGYLTIVRRTPVSYSIRGGPPQEYASPVYQLTERGLCWVLAHCDIDSLPGRVPLGQVDNRNEERFQTFANIGPWLSASPRHGGARYVYDVDHLKQEP